MEALFTETGSQRIRNLQRKVRAVVEHVSHVAPTKQHRSEELEDIDTIRSNAFAARDTYCIEKLGQVANADDLADAIDELLHDPTWHRITRRIQAVTPVEGSIIALLQARTRTPNVPEHLRGLAGENAALVAKIELASRYQAAVVTACLEYLEGVVARDLLDDSLSSGDNAPLAPNWFVHSTQPLGWKKAWLGRAQASIAQDALTALASSEAPPLWMVEELVDTWSRGNRRMLSMMVWMKGVTKPDPDLYDACDPVDVQTMVMVEETAERGYRERLIEARKVDGWYPEPEDERS